MRCATRRRPLQRQVTRDYTTSYVRFSPDAKFEIHSKWGAGPDAKTKQSVCLSLLLEPTFLAANAEFSKNTALFGTKLPTMYSALRVPTSTVPRGCAVVVVLRWRWLWLAERGLQPAGPTLDRPDYYI